MNKSSPPPQKKKGGGVRGVVCSYLFHQTLIWEGSAGDCHSCEIALRLQAIIFHKDVYHTCLVGNILPA